MVENLQRELAKVKDQVRGMVQRVQQSINRLDQIALKPNPLTEVDHLNLLIDSEKQQKNPGYQNRIKFYEEAKRNAEIYTKAKQGNENFLPDDDEFTKPTPTQRTVSGSGNDSGSGWGLFKKLGFKQ